MSEKVYKPIVKDGDHLIRSKNNPDRVRGLTRDENNQNQDIIEWEEYDIDDLRSNDYDLSSYKDQSVQLTQGQEEFAQQVGEALGAIVATIVATGATWLFCKYISPWWSNTARPWVKEKGQDIKKAVNRKREKKTNREANTVAKKQVDLDRKLAVVSSQIDTAFEKILFEMDEEEAKVHMMRLVYHMLGVVNEIRIISNARIRKDCESEELCIERQKEVEKFLSEKVATNLNQLLSNENLLLDLNTSRELFSLTGGGVRLNGEYIPVQAIKIEEALKVIPTPDS